MHGFDEAEELHASEAHDHAVLKHCGLGDASVVDVRLCLGLRGCDGDDAVRVGDHTVVRVDVRC